MKFIVSRTDLCEYTNRILNVIAPKTPIPILANFLLTAQGNEIVLTATDLTCSVRYTGKAQVVEEGAITIPARRFGQLIRELTATTLEISTNARGMIQVAADSSTFRLPGLPKEDFPALPDLEGATSIRMKQKDLRDLFFRTSFAVSKEDNRYVLTGVFFGIAKSVAVFAGTDGKRLARAEFPLPVEPTYKYESIIPLKAVDEIMKNLNSDDDEVTLSIMSDKIAVDANDMMIMTKLLSGDYPNVEKVIPKQTSSFVSLHREELMSLLRQVSLFMSDTNHSVRFSLNPGELNLSINTTDVGEGKVSMPVNYQGSRFDIAFNPIFFLDILRHSRSEQVSFGFSDSFNPGVIVDGPQQEPGALPSSLFVLMPMRLNAEVAQSAS